MALLFNFVVGVFQNSGSGFPRRLVFVEGNDYNYAKELDKILPQIIGENAEDIQKNVRAIVEKLMSQNTELREENTELKKTISEMQQKSSEIDNKIEKLELECKRLQIILGLPLNRKKPTTIFTIGGQELPDENQVKKKYTSGEIYFYNDCAEKLLFENDNPKSWDEITLFKKFNLNFEEIIAEVKKKGVVSRIEKLPDQSIKFVFEIDKREEFGGNLLMWVEDVSELINGQEAQKEAEKKLLYQSRLATAGEIKNISLI
jgi:regulator of replication initiation timing